jgi:hypothetical protein
MPDMRRKVFSITAAASLAICVATAGLWVRSYFAGDDLHRRTQWPEGGNWYRRQWRISSRDGGLRLDVETHVTNWPLRTTGGVLSAQGGGHLTEIGFDVNPRAGTGGRWELGRWYWTTSRPASLGPGEVLSGNLWFSLWTERKSGRQVATGVLRKTGFHLQIPHWFVVLLASLAPGVWLIRRHRRASRVRLGRCAGCGYDLRASPGRCPECGTPAVPATGR